MTPHETPPRKHRLTPTGLLVYFLTSEDTWRIAMGIALAVLSAPVLLPFDRTGLGRYVMFIAVVVIVWAVTKKPSQWIVRQIEQRLSGQ